MRRIRRVWRELSFFRPENSVPELGKGFVYNNIITPSLQELLGMKLFTITIRSAFRDYYDIYALLKEGFDLAKGVDYAGKFRNTMSQLMTLLTSSSKILKSRISR